MAQPNKDCAICVYDSVCSGRRNNPLIKDCCVPEAPLREKQRLARDTDDFAYVTNKYVASIKAQSEYWSKQ